MASKTPSIKSFFQTEVPAFKCTNPAPPLPLDPEQAGDGFTPVEIQAALHPLLPPTWQPRREYRDVDIKDLLPGPGCVMVRGQIVNFHEQAFSSKMPHAAKGCLSLIVKDLTGALRVKLHYAKVDYGLRLGCLVSVWMPHVSHAETTSSLSLTASDAALVTSIFPERDNSCFIKVLEESEGGGGLGTTSTELQCNGRQLAGLITLKNYIEGGHEVAVAKVLVCVRSVGGRKRFTNKKGIPCEKVEVHIFDDTADATFVLWGSSGASATDWTPSRTIILLSHASFHGGYRSSLSMNKDTHVEIDPPIADASWLRNYADRLTKDEHVNQPFPDGLFDIEEAASAANRILFTLADLDEFVRASPPTDHIIGYLNLTILTLNIVSLHQRSKLLCAECPCGVPLFANTPTATCKQCDNTDIPLRINPRLVGTLVDETGCITAGKLIWSEDAWWQLLGRTGEELVRSSAELVKYLEERLLFLRVWVMVGWAGKVGKLVVLRVGIV